MKDERGEKPAAIRESENSFLRSVSSLILRPSFIFLVVLALGLGLRLYRLDKESLDLEEYVTFIGIDAPNVFSYIHQVHLEYRTMTPLSFALQYGWVGIFGDSAVAVRSLAVLCGMLTIALLYAFTRRFYGGDAFARKAAVVAALCAALSPVHIFYSQEARQYPLLTLLAMASAYALMRAMREGGRRWWILNGLANFGVLFTHPLGVLWPALQGLFLLAFRWRRIRQTGAWGVIHVLMLVPLALWVRDMPKSSEAVFSGTEDSGLGAIVRHAGLDLVGDDAIHLAAQLGPAPRTWAFIPDHVAGPMMEAHGWFDAAMAIVFCAVVAWLLYRMIRVLGPARLVRGSTSKTEAGGKSGLERAAPGIEDYALLLMWFAGPPVAIGLISYLFTPCNMTRYTIYASLALYVMAGGAVASIRRPTLRIGAVAVIVVLYAYQLSLLLPGPIRTEWKPVAEHIRANGHPDDLALVHGPMFLPVLLLNGDDLPNPASATMSREGLCELIEFFFDQCASIEPAQQRPRDVWAMLFQGQGPGFEFQACLRTAGFTVSEPTIFKGSRQVLLYHVETDALASQDAAPPPPAVPIASFFNQMIAEYYDHPRMAQFQKSIMYDIDSMGAAHLKLGMTLAANGLPRMADIATSKAITMNPAWGTALTELYVSIVRADGDVPKLEQAILANPGNIYQIMLLAGIHQFTANFDEAIPLFRQAVERAPTNAWAALALWRALAASQEDDEGAKDALRKTLALDATLASQLGPLYDALYEAQDPRVALDELNRWRAAGLPIVPELSPILMAMSATAE